jgi:hypothetical protein
MVGVADNRTCFYSPVARLCLEYENQNFIDLYRRNQPKMCLLLTVRRLKAWLSAANGYWIMMLVLGCKE